MPTRRNVGVFFASSYELQEERRVSPLVLAGLNKRYPHLHVEPMMFELDTESGNYPGKKRIQDEINTCLDKSDIVVVLFYSQVGTFTKEELDRALIQNKKVFLYFKDGYEPHGAEAIKKYDELVALKEWVEKEGVIRYQKFDTPLMYKLLLSEDLDKYISHKIAEDKKKERIIGIGIPIFFLILAFFLIKISRISNKSNDLPISNTSKIKSDSTQVAGSKKPIKDTVVILPPQRPNNNRILRKLYDAGLKMANTKPFPTEKFDAWKNQCLNLLDKGNTIDSELRINFWSQDCIGKTKYINGLLENKLSN